MVKTDKHGRFEIEDLDEGTYEIEILGKKENVTVNSGNPNVDMGEIPVKIDLSDPAIPKDISTTGDTFAEVFEVNVGGNPVARDATIGSPGDIKGKVRYMNCTSASLIFVF